MTYPYTQNPGNLIAVVEKITGNGVPDKFTQKELGVWGYTSSNDRRIIGVLRYIRFLDDKSAPTDLWKKARVDAKGAVAEGVRAGYADLYKTFPNAEKRDNEALTNYFKGNTNVGDAAIKRMVSTFKALAEFGNFSASHEPATAAVGPVAAASAGAKPAPPGHSPAVGAPVFSSTQVGIGGSPSVNLNIELQLPADPTGDIYDKFFAAMRKHLYVKPDSE